MNEPTRIGLIPELPEKPTGWTRRMSMHLNYGSAGGAATFTIHDPEGNLAEFGYQYDTRKGGRTGFTLDGIEEVMTWVRLREVWPAWVAAKTGSAAQEGKDGKPA